MSENQIEIRTDLNGVDWKQAALILKRSGLSEAPAEVHKKAFTNSTYVAFVYDGEKLIGVSRALSDGVSQGAIYNVALLDEYQGRGLGRRMIQSLKDQMPGQNIILYTHPQTVLMYEKFGFRRAKSAMEYFPMEDEHKEWMEDEGFFLPEGFRFADEYKRVDMKGPKWDAKRIASQVPYEKLWASDDERKKLSADPDNVYKKHPEGETAEDYQSVISVSKWNSDNREDRNPANRYLSEDASINPITSKLRD